MARRRRPTRRAIPRSEFEPRCQRSITECELTVFLSIGSKLASYFVAIITETGGKFFNQKGVYVLAWRRYERAAEREATRHCWVWPISRVNMLHLSEPESHTRTWHPAESMT